MTNYCIECKSLTKIYKHKKNSFKAISDINLQIEKGEYILLKGKSGAGKSTLLYILGGLIKPTSGTVEIEGLNINNLNNNELSKILLTQIGFIFQSFNLLPTYNIYENIEVAIAPKRLDNKSIKNQIIPLLERFQLVDKMNLLPEELSIGQQQKVAIIRTLVKKPSIILADEPTGSVDEDSTKEILSIFEELKRENKVTIIFATHGTIPDSIADRVHIINNGQIIN